MTKTWTVGRAYRVRASHPRRGGPLRISDKTGTVIAVSGDTCEHVPSDLLASMIANDYVEKVDDHTDEAPF